MNSLLALAACSAAVLWLAVSLAWYRRFVPSNTNVGELAQFPPVVGFGAFLAFFLISIVVVVVVSSIVPIGGEGVDPDRLRRLFVGSLLSGCLIAGYLLLLGRPQPKFFPKGGPRLSWFRLFLEAIFSLVAWLPLVIAVNGLAQSIWPQPKDAANLIQQALIGPSPWDIKLLAALTAVVRAPIIEEWVFRGFVLGSFLAIGNVWASFLSAGLFAAVHSSWPDPLPLVFVGLMFGSTYLRTRTLAAPVLTHMIYNGAMTIAALNTPA